jgi:hypothetical protein
MDSDFVNMLIHIKKKTKNRVIVNKFSCFVYIPTSNKLCRILKLSVQGITESKETEQFRKEEAVQHELAGRPTGQCGRATGQMGFLRPSFCELLLTHVFYIV